MLLALLACSDQAVTRFNNEPLAAITSHVDGSEVLEGYTESFFGSASDPDHDPSDLVVNWYVDGERACTGQVPEADGTTSCDLTLQVNGGDVTMEVKDPEGAAGSDAVALTVVPTDRPVVELTSPTDDEPLYSDVLVVFEGIVSDGEDLAEDLVVWWQDDAGEGLDVDGQPDADGGVLGYGYLAEGDHALTLWAQDSSGKTGSDGVVVTVGPPNSPPTCTIDEPASGGSSESGAEVTFRGSVGDVDIGPERLVLSWSSDRDGSLSTSDASSDGSTGVSTSSLSIGTHQIALRVEDDLGAVCSESIAWSVGTPPDAEIDSPGTGTTVNEGDTVSFEGSVSDDQSTADELAVSWSSSVDGVLHEAPPDSSGRTAFSTADLRAGTHAISLTVTDTDGLYATDSLTLTVNGLPGAPVISLAPSNPTSDDSLSVAIDTAASDPEGDPITYSYAWFVGGTASSASTTATLPASATARDDTWRVDVTPNDGSGDGTAGSAEVTIGNSAPTVSSVTLSPDPAGTDDTLSCTPATASDADGDTVAYAYAWDVSGSDPGATTSSLSDEHHERGDTVTCTVTPTDGTDDGAAVASNTVTVANTAPSVSEVALSPDPAYAGETLSCSWAFDDADGDSDQSTASWAVGGATVASGTSYSGSFVRGDVVACTVTPDDGSDTGSDVSASLTIANTAPSITSVSISPNPADAADTLTCTYSGFSDVDGDSDASLVTWSVDGSTVGTGTTLASGFAKDDVVTCTVTPSDGLDDGTTRSASLTIDNNAPSIGSVSISPSAAYTDDTLVASASATDADGDGVDVDYDWYVEGSWVAVGSSLDGAVYFEKDETVYVVATPNDGEDTGASATSSSVTVLNSPPSAPVIAIDPSDPVAEVDDLWCELVTESTDADGDDIDYAFDWEVEGSAYPSGDSAELGPDTTEWSDDTVPAEDLFEDETWTCTVYPHDGDTYGDPDVDSVTVGAESEDSYSGSWSVWPSVSYSCAYGLVSVSVSTLSVVDSYPSIIVSGGGSQPGTMTGSFTATDTFTASSTLPGTCTETYTLSGTFTDTVTFSGTLSASYSGGLWCFDCTNQSFSVTATR